MKQKFYFIIIALILAFVLGRVSVHAPVLSQIKTEEVKVSKEQKDSTTAQQTNYVEKRFNNKGILVHEIVMGNKIENIEVSKTENHEIQKIEQKFIPADRFDMGFMIDPKKIAEPSNLKISDLQFVAACNVVGNIKIIGSANTKSQFQVGVLLSF